MENYLRLLSQLVSLSEETSNHRTDRTATGTVAVFGTKLQFDLQNGFPILTTKKVHFRSVVAELLWFLRGETNIDYLHRYGVTIWDEWADANGELGPIYGSQWRNWNGEGIDQISNCVHSLIHDPNSRRHIISAWNVSAIPKMRLPPCHILVQFFVDNNNLSCQVYQRSCDVFLGLPFNIASYALLLSLMAKTCGYNPHTLIWIGGDTHLYQNHIQAAKTQLERAPKPSPKLIITETVDKIWEYQIEHISLEHYDAYPAIKAPIAV
ncbi:MAG: thymidylate synthase [Methylacidiphilales bacterium]|nr:thymidylate synthase [Candidatus Methylacidiphilales bacterium]